VLANPKFAVDLEVDNPREVGADRVVNTLAAHRLCGTACVVVDFGTSTNIDVVSAKGEFLGGALAPGIEIAEGGLERRARKNPKGKDEGVHLARLKELVAKGRTPADQLLEAVEGAPDFARAVVEKAELKET